MLGVAYKKNVDDMRESPSANILDGGSGLSACVASIDVDAHAANDIATSIAAIQAANARTLALSCADNFIFAKRRTPDGFVDWPR